MASQRDVKNRIASVKNIQKITRAMEMVAAARLRRAEQRIAALRPYADALRRMTRQAAQAAGAEASGCRCSASTSPTSNVGLLLITGDRGLAGGFNSQIIRAGIRIAAELGDDGLQAVWYATGRRGVSSLTFRGRELSGSYTGFADRPAYADARAIADDLIDRLRRRSPGPAWRSSTTPTSPRSPSRSPARRCCRCPPATIAGEGPEERQSGEPLEHAKPARPRARSSTTSPIPRRSSSDSCRTTSRSRSTERWSSRPPASSAPR